jgi:hypothetical protein
MRRMSAAFDVGLHVSRRHQSDRMANCAQLRILQAPASSAVSPTSVWWPSVALALDEDVENITLLIDRTPEPVLLAGNGDDDPVQAPFVATTWHSPADAVSKFPAEFQAH